MSTEKKPTKKGPKQIAVVKIQRKGGNHLVYVKAPFASRLFKSISKQAYGEPRVNSVSNNEGDNVYSYYVIPQIPQTTYSLRASQDTINHYGYLRSPQLSKGLYVPLTTPMTNDIAQKLAERIMMILQDLHTSYINEHTITHVLVEGET